MKNSSLQTINKLIVNLPDDDLKFGKKYLAQRDFDSLELLTRSAIKNVEKALSSGSIEEFKKYKSYIDDLSKFERLKRLSSEVASYNEMLNSILDEEDNFEYEPYINPDDFSSEDIIW